MRAQSEGTEEHRAPSVNLDNTAADLVAIQVWEGEGGSVRDDDDRVAKPADCPVGGARSQAKDR